MERIKWVIIFSERGMRSIGTKLEIVDDVTCLFFYRFLPQRGCEKTSILNRTSIENGSL